MSTDQNLLKPPAVKRRNSEVNEDFKDEISSIMEKIEGEEAVSPIDYLKNIFIMTKSLNDKQNDVVLSVKKAEKRTEKLEARVDKVELNLTKMEFANLSSTVIIRGLDMHPRAINRSESFAESAELVTNVLTALEIQSQVTVVEASRFASGAQSTQMRSAEPAKAPPVKATFRNKNETNNDNKRFPTKTFF